MQQLAQELELLPGHRVRVTGAEAIALAARLGRFRGEIRGDAHRELRARPARSRRA